VKAAPVRRTVLLGSLATLLGCPTSPSAPSDAGLADGAPASPALATAAPVAETQAPEQPDPQALAELLAATPSARPPSTGLDGGTLVGTETGFTGDPATPEPSARPAGGVVTGMQVGEPEVLPLLSTPAIERAARQLIYWNLMKNCRGPDDALVPPDMITLVFTIRSDGSVDPASVGASAAEKRYEATAECVVREFSASPFRGPAATIRSSARIIVTWPSVD
jgi:hypothetical protein